MRCDLVEHYIESAEQGLYHWKYDWKANLIVLCQAGDWPGGNDIYDLYEEESKGLDGPRRYL